MNSTKTPVFLLTGFLGSGKTTLLNAALRSPEFAETAVIVNELGEIGLDHLIISQARDNVLLLDSGCLCCVSNDTLQETLADIASRRARGELPFFRRVIIETSGVADPAPLLNVLSGHSLVTSQYTLEATVCVVDAQHFLASRIKYPQLDKQVVVAERIVLSKTDLAEPASILALLKSLNPHAELLSESAAISAFCPCDNKYRPPIAIASLGPIIGRARISGYHAYSFLPSGVVTWAGWSAWSRLVAREFEDRLIRVKGLLYMEDTGQIAFVHGVQGVFHSPQRLGDWPDADHRNRLVCIVREIKAEEIALTLPALNAPAGTNIEYSLYDLKTGMCDRDAQ